MTGTPLPVLPDQPPPAPPAEWNVIWRMAVTQPSVDFYSRLAHAPLAGARRAHLWILFSALAGAITSGSIAVLIRFLTEGVEAAQAAAGNLNTLDLLIVSPLVALFALAFFVIEVNVVLLIAHLLGGKGLYPRLAFVSAAFAAPLIILGLIIQAIPIFFYTDILVGFLLIYLQVVAVRAVTGLNASRSLAAVMLALVILLALVGCPVLMLLFAVRGP